MTWLAASLLIVLVGTASAAGVQTKGPVPQPPSTPQTAPTPAPLAPPTSSAPVVAPPDGLSPLLAQPGPLYSTPPRVGPTYPASPNPGPLDQQKMQSYRNDLIGQRWQLDRQGVSPDNQRYREIQQQLNQPGPR